MSLRPLRPCPSRGRAAVALLFLGLAASAANGPALAGDAPGAPAPQAAAPAASPRMTAVDLEIRALERRLTALRRVRADLHAGRGEALAADAEARRTLLGELRAVREVARYEAGRAKALAALEQALASKDDAKISEARAALDAQDTRFGDAIRKLEEARDGADATTKGASRAGGGAAGNGGADDGERAKKPSKSTPKAPAGDGMVASDDLDGDLLADEDGALDDALLDGASR